MKVHDDDSWFSVLKYLFDTEMKTFDNESYL